MPTSPPIRARGLSRRSARDTCAIVRTAGGGCSGPGHAAGWRAAPSAYLSRRRLAQRVADAAHGVQQPRLALGLGLAALVADVDLEGVLGGGEVVAPHLLEDPGPGEHLARVPDEQLQQGELGA